MFQQISQYATLVSVVGYWQIK